MLRTRNFQKVKEILAALFQILLRKVTENGKRTQLAKEQFKVSKMMTGAANAKRTLVIFLMMSTPNRKKNTASKH